MKPRSKLNAARMPIIANKLTRAVCTHPQDERLRRPERALRSARVAVRSDAARSVRILFIGSPLGHM